MFILAAMAYIAYGAAIFIFTPINLIRRAKNFMIIASSTATTLEGLFIAALCGGAVDECAFSSFSSFIGVVAFSVFFFLFIHLLFFPMAVLLAIDSNSRISGIMLGGMFIAYLGILAISQPCIVRFD